MTKDITADLTPGSKDFHGTGALNLTLNKN
jgi:hypothetical protein